MDDHTLVPVTNNGHTPAGPTAADVVDIYPLNGYFFGSKDPLPLKQETLVDRFQRLQFNYEARGLRTCVHAVILTFYEGSMKLLAHLLGIEGDYNLRVGMISHWLIVVPFLALVELFKHPHLLLLQVRNTTFRLPGGRLRPGESDVDGLRRKLSRRLSLDDARDESQWEVGECLGMWWRLDFETLLYPYLPPNSKKPKECSKIFLVKLPVSRKFIVPKNMKLLAVPLCQLHENHKTYGSVIAGIPQLLSKFSFNMIET